MPSYANDYGCILGWGDDAVSTHLNRRRAAVQWVGEYRTALETVAQIYSYVVASKTCGASCTTTTINCTSHGAKVGDRIVFTSGTFANVQVFVDSVTDANNFKISTTLSGTPANGDAFSVLRPASPVLGSALGGLSTDITQKSASFTHSNPTVATATSTTLLAANANRRYFFIQNNSAANIAISLSAATITGIVPSNSNPVIVIPPSASFECPPNAVPTGAITGYQTSGGSISTITCVEA